MLPVTISYVALCHKKLSELVHRHPKIGMGLGVLPEYGKQLCRKEWLEWYQINA